MPEQLKVSALLARKEGGLYVTLASAEGGGTSLALAFPHAKPEDFKGMKGHPCPPIAMIAGMDAKPIGEQSFVPHAVLVVMPTLEQAAPAAPVPSDALTAEAIKEAAELITQKRAQAILYLYILLKQEAVPIPAAKNARLEALNLTLERLIKEMP